MANEQKLMPCPTCGKPISVNARQCPACGEPVLEKHRKQRQAEILAQKRAVRNENIARNLDGLLQKRGVRIAILIFAVIIGIYCIIHPLLSASYRSELADKFSRGEFIENMNYILDKNEYPRLQEQKKTSQYDTGGRYRAGDFFALEFAPSGKGFSLSALMYKDALKPERDMKKICDIFTFAILPLFRKDVDLKELRAGLDQLEMERLILKKPGDSGKHEANWEVAGMRFTFRNLGSELRLDVSL